MCAYSEASHITVNGGYSQVSRERLSASEGKTPNFEQRALQHEHTGGALGALSARSCKGRFPRLGVPQSGERRPPPRAERRALPAAGSSRPARSWRPKPCDWIAALARARAKDTRCSAGRQTSAGREEAAPRGETYPGSARSGGCGASRSQDSFSRPARHQLCEVASQPGGQEEEEASHAWLHPSGGIALAAWPASSAAHCPFCRLRAGESPAGCVLCRAGSLLKPREPVGGWGLAEEEERLPRGGRHCKEQEGAQGGGPLMQLGKPLLKSACVGLAGACARPREGLW